MRQAFKRISHRGAIQVADVHVKCTRLRWTPRALLFLALLWPLLVHGFEIHSPAHCLYGCPKGSPPDSDLIVREVYILSSNDLTKFADWVAYRVTPDTVGHSQTRNWRKDPLLAPNETLEPNDYRNASEILGTDRGHQAPLASFSGTPHWADTNLLSNITPQAAALNQGAWARLEEAVRKLARQSDVAAVYVMTGPIYERAMRQLPGTQKPHMVPSGYWKIIAIDGGTTIEAAGFIMDQETPRNASHCGYLAALSDIESRSGLSFFHGLDAKPEIVVRFNQAGSTARVGCTQ